MRSAPDHNPVEVVEVVTSVPLDKYTESVVCPTLSIALTVGVDAMATHVIVAPLVVCSPPRVGIHKTVVVGDDRRGRGRGSVGAEDEAEMVAGAEPRRGLEGDIAGFGSATHAEPDSEDRRSQGEPPCLISHRWTPEFLCISMSGLTPNIGVPTVPRRTCKERLLPRI